MVRFASNRPIDDVSQEERAALSIMDPLVRGKDQLVGDSDTAAQGDPQPALLLGLADGRIFRRLLRILSATWQDQPRGCRDDRDIATGAEDHHITAWTQDIGDPRYLESELSDGYFHANTRLLASAMVDTHSFDVELLVSRITKNGAR